MDRYNWANNYKYSASGVHYPELLDEIRDLVRRSAKVRALGSGHSFNGVADTTGDHISTERLNLNKEPNIDAERLTVTVRAGIRYGELCRYLNSREYALRNLASLPHISVAGSCATATHGSGVGNANLATAVSGIEIVTADGSLQRLTREHDGDRFAGAVVGLGALGIVTEVSLNIVPAFKMRQHVYENLPFSEVEAHFDEIMSCAYSVSLFTNWGESVHQVWIKQLVEDGSAAPPWGDGRYGGTLATHNLHPVPELYANWRSATEQLGVVGSWHERLPHFRIDEAPSSGGDELQAEYLVPRGNAVDALRAIRGLHELIEPLLLTSEVRTVAADDLWMSPCYRQPCAGIHFTFKRDEPAVALLLPQIEERLLPLGARPHWGKLFTISDVTIPIIQAQYERLPDFRRLLHEFDPAGKFRNAFVDAVVG